jgi:hypothetical protein
MAAWKHSAAKTIQLSKSLNSRRLYHLKYRQNFFCRYNTRLTGKYFLHQDTVHFFARGVCAAIRYHHQFVIQVGPHRTVVSTHPWVAIPKRIRVSAPRFLRTSFRLVVVKGPVRFFVNTTSPGFGVTPGWISISGVLSPFLTST